MSYFLVSEVTVSLTDLMSVLLGMAGVVVLVALAIFLINLNSTVKKIKSMLDELTLPISQSINQIPEIIKKTDKSLTDVNTITESAAETVPEVLNEVSDVTSSLGTTVQTVANTATNVVDGVDGAVTGIKRGAGKVASSGILSSVFGNLGRITAVLAMIRRFKKKRKRR
ncbi:MAG: hypothetical protein GX326_08310 [Clostridiaceae bacterium]|nr:hypothetical protein [Clostridiaceae bacterium]